MAVKGAKLAADVKSRGAKSKGVKSAVSQQRVLDAAARIFRDAGYAGTTMRAVADEAGLQAGSLYYHYKSKDELIGAVLDSGVTKVATSVENALAALPDGVTARVRIETAIKSHVVAIIACGDYTLATRRVFGQVPPLVRTRHLRLRDAYGAIWDDLFTHAQTAGELRPDADPKVGRLFVLGALNWTAEWYKPGARSIDDIAHEFSALVLDGLIRRKDDAAEPVKELVHISVTNHSAGLRSLASGDGDDD